MRHRRPDITKLKNLTKFKPRFSIDNILQDTIEFFEE